MSASDAAPLPRLGEVFFDVRGNSRSMRLSWYADTGVAVFSIWQGGKCTGTFRLPIDDLPRMVEILQRGPQSRRSRPSGGRSAGWEPGAPDPADQHDYPTGSYGQPGDRRDGGYGPAADYSQDSSYGHEPGYSQDYRTDRRYGQDRDYGDDLEYRQQRGYSADPGYPGAADYAVGPDYPGTSDYSGGPDYAAGRITARPRITGTIAATARSALSRRMCMALAIPTGLPIRLIGLPTHRLLTSMTSRLGARQAIPMAPTIGQQPISQGVHGIRRDGTATSADWTRRRYFPGRRAFVNARARVVS